MQKEFSQATLRIFKVVRERAELPYDTLPDWFKAHFVLVLYTGPYDQRKILPLKEGRENVSGKELHIREGVVVAPAVPRTNADGHNLQIKLISSQYAKKETSEEIS